MVGLLLVRGKLEEEVVLPVHPAVGRSVALARITQAPEVADRTADQARLEATVVLASAGPAEMARAAPVEELAAATQEAPALSAAAAVAPTAL
jgi:hypothetical protein